MSKSASKTKVKDCVACIMYPMFTLGCIVGYTPLKIRCPHKTNASPVATFEKSRSLVQMNALINVLFCILIVIYCIDMFWNEKDHFTEKIIQIVDIFLILNGLFSGIFSQKNMNEKVLELKGMTFLLEWREYYGFQTVLNAKDTKLLLMKSYVLIGIVYVMLSISIGIILSDVTKFKDVYMVTIYVTFWIINMFVQCAFIYQALITTELYKTIFQVSFSKLKSILNGRLQRNANSESELFVVQLKKFVCFYRNLVTNFRQLNRFYNPTILLWWLTEVAMMILTTYYLILSYFGIVNFDLFLAFLVYASMGSLAMYLIISEGINVVNEDILRFMYKYPISHLTTEEAGQVEVLIVTLKIDKPELNASGVFSVGTQLLASISGTVVTYVLVALQFHDASARK